MTDLTSRSAELERALDDHRVELTGYCYRMTGSAADAEDAVQETMVRAWRAIDRFEGRSSLRSWLYRIATNVCLDQLRGRGRRALPVDLSEEWQGGPPTRMLGDGSWVEPMADHLTVPTVDPGEAAVARESVRLAFIAALQLLPPRQRAVLVLREVLRWPAAEVADLLDTTVASVNSALQRARATIDAAEVVDRAPVLEDPAHQALLERYLDAFERYDVGALVEILHDDATTTMPPFALFVRGPEDVARWWLGNGKGCEGSRFIPVEVNASLAFAQYKPSPDGGWAPWAIQTVEVAEGKIVGMGAFIDSDLFARYGLPDRLD